MRTIISIMSACLISLALMIGATPAAQAQSNSGYHPVYPNAWALNVNQACPKGSDKMFIAALTVEKGVRITEFGEMYLQLKNKRFLVDEGYQMNQRRVEYYFFPKSRKARVRLNDLRGSLLYATFVSQTADVGYYSLRLRMQCVGQMP